MENGEIAHFSLPQNSVITTMIKKGLLKTLYDK